MVITHQILLYALTSQLNLAVHIAESIVLSIELSVRHEKTPTAQQLV